MDISTTRNNQPTNYDQLTLTRTIKLYRNGVLQSSNPNDSNAPHTFIRYWTGWSSAGADLLEYEAQVNSSVTWYVGNNHSFSANQSLSF